ncbi:MAG TPA: glycosyltransferase [Pyrinomonadaceae bacterium]|nr:glycosyltransferase [Pyrinomonadaceae bacterium]
MLVFYFLGAIALWLGIGSLRNGIQFSRYVRRELAQPPPDFTPTVTIIAPCRGLDQGLTRNIEALFEQDYPAYEIIFVTDRSDDPALSVIDEVRKCRKEAHSPATRVVIAGPASDSGQKVHNLQVATEQIASNSEVLAFVDTDTRPDPNWLRSLVRPLSKPEIGAATGYRWFIPVNGGFASQLRSVWNASITSALGERDEKNFCWGGSTAVRRETFESLQMRERWRGTVSDDFALTGMFRKAGLRIHFVPQCLIASLEDCNFRELVEFTNRQLKITRVYAPHLWKALLLGSALFNAVFFGGGLLIVIRAMLGLSFGAPLVLIGTIYVLGTTKAFIRFRAVKRVLNGYQSELNGSLLFHLLLWPFASLLYLNNAVSAALSRRIKWRGITYELKSPTEAVIISRE